MREPEGFQRRLDLIEGDVRTVTPRVVEIEVHERDLVGRVLCPPPCPRYRGLGRIMPRGPVAFLEERGQEAKALLFIALRAREATMTPEMPGEVVEGLVGHHVGDLRLMQNACVVLSGVDVPQIADARRLLRAGRIRVHKIELQ